MSLSRLANLNLFNCKRMKPTGAEVMVLCSKSPVSYDDLDP